VRLARQDDGPIVGVDTKELMSADSPRSTASRLRTDPCPIRRFPTFRSFHSHRAGRQACCRRRLASKQRGVDLFDRCQAAAVLTSQSAHSNSPGLPPDTISSDITYSSPVIRRACRTLPNVMSKFMLLGFRLKQVVTIDPAPASVEDHQRRPENPARYRLLRQGRTSPSWSWWKPGVILDYPQQQRDGNAYLKPIRESTVCRSETLPIARSR